MPKAFFQNIFLTIISIAIAFYFKVYVAEISSKDVLASFFTSLDIISLLFIIFVGSRTSMIVFYSQNKDDTTILNIFRISLIITLLIAWTFILPYVKHELNLNISYSYLVSIFISFGFYIYYINQLGMYKLYGAMNAVTIIEPLLIFGWFCLAYHSFNLTVVHSLVISTIMTYSTISVFIYLAKPYKEPPIKKPILDEKTKKFLVNCFYSSVEFIFGILTIYLSVILFVKFYSVSDIADFQVVVKPIYMYFLSIFAFPIFKFVLPQLSSNIAKKEFNKVEDTKKWMIKYSIIVGLGSFLFINIFSENIVIYCFSELYINSIDLLNALSLSFIFLIINSFSNSVLKSFGEFKATMTIRGIGIFLFIISFFIIKNFIDTPLAVIYALNISHIAQFIAYQVTLKYIKKAKT
jgi:O-antigen/teichoic acid export membrane protein